MKIEIQLPEDAFEKMADAIDDMVVSALGELGQAQIANIRRRAMMGIGLDDRAMPAYSPGYRAQRARAGRNTDIRDLSWSGRMLGAIHLEGIERQGNEFIAPLGFADRESLDKAIHNQQRAPWYGVSPNDAEILRNLWESGRG